MFPTDYIIFLHILLFLFISPRTSTIVIVSHTLAVESTILSNNHFWLHRI